MAAKKTSTKKQPAPKKDDGPAAFTPEEGEKARNETMKRR